MGSCVWTPPGATERAVCVQAERADARAAARMIEVIDNMLSMIEIDTQPLLDQATKIEKEIQGSLDMLKRSLEHRDKEPAALPGPMYR